MPKRATKKVARKVPTARRDPSANHGAGFKFISSVIACASPSRLSDVSREWFIDDDELALFDRVRDYMSRHRTLPTLEALRSEGLRLPDVAEPATYHLARMRNRHLFNLINTSHPDLRAAMEARDADAAVEVIRNMSVACGAVGASDEFSSMDETMAGVYESYEFSRAHVGELHGVTYGRSTLDAVTLGAARGEVSIVCGRPGTGKSFEILTMAKAANDAGHSVGIITMEMSKHALGRRWLGIHTGINPHRLRSGEVTEWGDQLIRGEHASLTQGGRPPVTLLAGDFNKDVGGVARMFERFMPDILFVDAMYLMTAEGGKKGYVSRWENIAGVIGGIKSAAIKYDRPVVCTVQFNRNRKDSQRGDPDLSDIAGSDSIPQDADLVIGGMHAAPPFEDSRRRWKIMKSREGVTGGSYTTRFNFEPVCFDEVDVEAEAEAEATHRPNDWMV